MGIAGAAGIASLGSMALSATGSIMKGYGTQAADEFQAQQAQRAAEIGKMQALSTDTTMRQKFNITFGNIESIRAAGHIDPTSPTTAALLDRERTSADMSRMAAVGTIRQQVAQDEASAAYLQKAGDFAVGMGYFGAATDVAGGLAKYLTSPTGAG